MRGDVIFQVYGVHEGREKDNYFGAFRTPEEAQAEIAQLSRRVMNGSNWAAQYHNKGFVVRENVVTTDFELPSRPKPRDLYFVTSSAEPNQPGTWDSARVEVFRRGRTPNNKKRICEYLRNYGLLQTFEPFRQGNRQLALISRCYTRTAVLDLASGEVIAEESPANSGFCPVGFFVPDWWDLHDGSTIPGCQHWCADDEWPVGDFGFVWGCAWGDDSSWKVQYLDLSRVQEGIIGRDERFGYVELATHGYTTPSQKPASEVIENSVPPPFIQVSQYEGVTKVNFAVEMAFDLGTGKPEEWQRLGIKNLE